MIFPVCNHFRRMMKQPTPLKKLLCIDNDDIYNDANINCNKLLYSGEVESMMK